MFYILKSTYLYRSRGHFFFKIIIFVKYVNSTLERSSSSILELPFQNQSVKIS